MPKKCEKRSEIGRSSNLCSQAPANTSKFSAILDYVLCHVKDDRRPYLRVNIYGVEFLGLLDSGCNITVIGKYGWDILKNVCVLNNTTSKTCTVANGETCSVSGSVSVPLTLENKTIVMSVLVVPSLPHCIILGVDFWSKMKVVPDLFSGIWNFRSDDSEICVNALQAVDHLKPVEKQKLDEFIEQTFQNMPDKLGCTHIVEHEIRTNSPPIKQRHYPLSPVLQKQVNQELDQMLKDGIIEPSNSPWASPIVLVKKPDGTFRFCVNYKKLNEVSLPDAYPLPFISSTLDKLRDARYLTTLDIKSAYWQIPVAESSRPYTAFVVPTRGLFQFRRMPFGLHNAPATWQRFIDRVIGVDLEQYCFVYLDDICICTPTFEKHLEVLQTVINRIRDAGLTLNREKCKFCKPELKFLGYVVGASGLMVDPEKVEAIIRIPIPKTVSEVRRLVGIASWYRRFVPNFSTIVSPLTSLLRKNAKFVWDSNCEAAFEQIKNCLVSAPILTCPNFDLPFTIQTDASDYGIAGVLTQVQDGHEKVICYVSRSLTKSERRFSVTEKETLAVLFAVEKLRPYVEGTRFTVVTDHYSLKWLFSIKDPVGRIARWALRLQQYDFEVVHRKGKDSVVPDALSRAVPVIDTLDVSDQTSDKWYQKMLSQVTENPDKYPLWRSEQGKLYKKVRLRYSELRDIEWLEVVPKDKRGEVIQKNHDPPTCGHLGTSKTASRISEKFYWPKLYADVAKYVRNCTICLSTKPEQKKPAGLMLSQVPTVTRPWQLVSVDIVGPLPRSSNGNSYILSVCDCFSKYVLLFPLRSVTAPNVTKLIEEQVILIYGAPNKIISDNGVQFKSRLYKDMLDKYDIKPSYTANYHPQCNPVERIHRVVKTMLTSYVSDNQRQWDKYIARIGWAIRSCKHDVTGETPNFINFGREVCISGTSKPKVGEEIQFQRESDKKKPLVLHQLYQDVQKRLKKAYERSRNVYNLRKRDEKFSQNQKVWKRNFAISDASKHFTSKLAPKFTGPFTISRVLSPYTYELVDNHGRQHGVWHAKDLKAHPPDN